MTDLNKLLSEIAQGIDGWGADGSPHHDTDKENLITALKKAVEQRDVFILHYYTDNPDTSRIDDAIQVSRLEKESNTELARILSGGDIRQVRLDEIIKALDGKELRNKDNI